MVDRFGLGCWIYCTFIIMSSPLRREDKGEGEKTMPPNISLSYGGRGLKYMRRKNE